jgi:hypothetical protein
MRDTIRLSVSEGTEQDGTTRKPDFSGENILCVLAAWAVYNLVTARSDNKLLKAVRKLNK